MSPTSPAARGLIPTYAGNTLANQIIFSHERAHPHVCGEHWHTSSLKHTSPGSSPRMRGTPRIFFANPCSMGLIPTYAGNTFRPRWFCAVRRAHPHVCGEHPLCQLASSESRGSSPRMRGTPQMFGDEIPQNGLIPTYAGNTGGARSAGLWSRAHPHVCGEHAGVLAPAGLYSGSSPRMRGTPQVLGGDTQPGGLIPTYAGNTYLRAH